MHSRQGFGVMFFLNGCLRQGFVAWLPCENDLEQARQLFNRCGCGSAPVAAAGKRIAADKKSILRPPSTRAKRIWCIAPPASAASKPAANLHR